MEPDRIVADARSRHTLAERNLQQPPDREEALYQLTALACNPPKVLVRRVSDSGNGTKVVVKAASKSRSVRMKRPEKLN